MLELGQSPAEAPEELVRRLTQLHVCRYGDFRRARSSVRRLSRDLLPFDSVWIDALVQLRRLTPHQARVIEFGSANELFVHDHVVTDELGHGPHGTTLLARPVGRKERVVLKRLHLAIEEIPDCRVRLSQLLERSRDWSQPNLELPRTLLGDAGSLVLVSDWIPGLTLADLLVRRGRLPADVVLDIARQLATGLSSLYRLGLVHGDIRLSNVRLTAGGSAVLVDGGIRPAICPELTIHDTLALDSYDGVAPELIGTGESVSAASEMYSLGCLLWHLLTGRPPHWMADALMKLAAHQTQHIPNVRTLAPDTPDAMATMIEAMTSIDPNERPRSFDDLLQRWGRPGIASRWRLKHYQTHFDGAVPHLSQTGMKVSESRLPLIAVSLFVFAGLAFTVADRGFRNELLAVPQHLANAIGSQTKGNASSSDGSGIANDNASQPGQLLPLPSPSADGVIVLAEPGPYDVARVAFAGDLTVRGAKGVNPVIHVGRESLWLSGSTIKLERVTVASVDEATTPSAMVLIKSQRLILQDCLFVRSESSDDQHTNDHTTMVAWRPSETEAVEPDWQIDVNNCLFRGTAAAIWMAEVPRHLTLSNSLKLGQGTCFAVSPKATVHSSHFELTKLTLRETGPMLRLAGTFAEQANAPAIQITASDCVIALAAKTGLVELHSSARRSDANATVQVTGKDSVITPGSDLIAIVDPSSGGRESIDADDQFEGIIVSDLEFAGPLSGDVTGSRLQSLTAPRPAGASPPGVDVSRLPGDSRTAAVPSTQRN